MSSINTLLATLSTSAYGSEILCAVPYNAYGLPFFYFSSEEEYNEKLEAAQELDLIKNLCGDFEHEIQFIDGEGSQKLIDTVQTMEEYFRIVAELETLDEHQQAAMHALTERLGMTTKEALDALEDAHVIEGTATDYAYDIAQESGLDGFALTYFDSEKFARDMDLNGEILEFRFNHTEYVLTNVQGL